MRHEPIQRPRLSVLSFPQRTILSKSALAPATRQVATRIENLTTLLSPSIRVIGVSAVQLFAVLALPSGLSPFMRLKRTNCENGRRSRAYMSSLTHLVRAIRTSAGILITCWSIEGYVSDHPARESSPTSLAECPTCRRSSNSLSLVEH